jgi:flagellar biosynthesis protein FlhF
LSTKPAPEGVEVLAMASESVDQIEKVAENAPLVAAPRGSAASRASRESLAARVDRQNIQPAPATGRRAAAPEVQQDAEQMAMSTLSFQDYVRERMLKRRQAAMGQGVDTDIASPAVPADRQAERQARGRRRSPGPPRHPPRRRHGRHPPRAARLRRRDAQPVGRARRARRPPRRAATSRT